MIISIAAPKGGVGSSTFALLLTQERAKFFKTLLIDLSTDPVLDLYSGTDHIVPPEFNGNLNECSVELQGVGNVKLARVRPDQLALLNLTEEANKKDLEIIMDVGRPNEKTIEFLAKEKIPLILVLTQDNGVLRAGDELLGQLRDAGVESSFIISKKEDLDPSELADLNEIFDLIEEDYFGTISWDSDLRIHMNQGKPDQVSNQIKEEIGKINKKLDSTLMKNKDDTINLDSIEASAENSLGEETFEETDISSQEEILGEPGNVFSKIKQFFQNFGKGNE